MLETPSMHHAFLFSIKGLQGRSQVSGSFPMFITHVFCMISIKLKGPHERARWVIQFAAAYVFLCVCMGSGDPLPYSLTLCLLCMIPLSLKEVKAQDEWIGQWKWVVSFPLSKSKWEVDQCGLVCGRLEGGNGRLGLKGPWFFQAPVISGNPGPYAHPLLGPGQPPHWLRLEGLKRECRQSWKGKKKKS